MRALQLNLRANVSQVLGTRVTQWRQYGNWAWKRLEPQGTGPIARSSLAISVVGTEKKYALIFGGEHIADDSVLVRKPVEEHDASARPTQLMHRLDLEDGTWVTEDQSGIPGPSRVAAILATSGENTYVFGGRDGEGKNMDDMYVYRKDSGWGPSGELPKGPAARSYHTGAAARDGVFVFGGCGEAGRLNDLWRFDVNSSTWEELAPLPAEGRGGSCLVAGACGQKLYLFGGFCGYQCGDFHSFDLSTGTWEKLEFTGDVPSPRSVCGLAAVNNSTLVLFGGEVKDAGAKGHAGAGIFTNDTFVLDLSSGSWRRGVESDAPAPAKRGWFGFHGVGSQSCLLFGGNGLDNLRLGDIYLLHQQAE